MEPRYAIRTSSRVVFMTPTRVYKIPVSRRGWLQGINERKAWNRYKGSGRLAPLLWSLGGVVCMVRVTELTFVAEHHIKALKSLIPALNIERCDLYNTKNWGYHNNRIVLLDYGLNAQVASMY